MNTPEPDYVILHGRNCSAVLEVHPDCAPFWRYWGPRLCDGISPGAGIRETRSLPSFSIDEDQPLSLFPTFGVGGFDQSALLAHREGRDYAQAITCCTIESRDENSTCFRLVDDVAAFEIEIRLTLDPASDVLTLSTHLANRGNAVLDVQWLAAGVIPLPPEAVSVRSYGGRHNNEFLLAEDPLSTALWRRENRRGLTSHSCFPGAVVLTSNGATYGAQIGWSGNHVQTIERLDDGRSAWLMGEWLAPGEVRLAPGETLRTPDVLATCSTEGPGGVARNFHAAIRALVDWPDGSMKPRPVHLNTWEGFYFDHDEAALGELADSAAAIGIERFILDDGWFHRRNDDQSSLGDWWPDATKYPNGLKPLADRVTNLGMEFGLWVEPEMVNPDSDLFRAHPDWALQIAGRPLITGRNQLVLDMDRKEVADHVFETLSSILENLPISYLKWDHNRDLTTAGETAKYRRQVHATYALLRRVRSAFPAVEIESCAGGGGRIDAGIARYVHRFWSSDCIDAVTRLALQRGFLQFMPPELMGAHVGTAPAHSTGRSQQMDFRAAVALPGHFGVELDVRKLAESDRETLMQWIAKYKAHRSLVHNGHCWFGDASDGAMWQAHGQADDMLLLVYRTDPVTQRYPSLLALPMLDGLRRYSVELENGDASVWDGAWLKATGLPLAQMKAEQCCLFRIRTR